MLNYLLELLMMASLGFVLYLVARTLPRVNDADLVARSERGLPKWFVEYLERLDEKLLTVVEKVIRRTRLSILKVDNALMKRLGRFRKEGAKENGLAAGIGNGGNGKNGEAHEPPAV